MNTADPAQSPDEQLLIRLAELDLTAAEHVHARLMAAEAADEVAELGRTYQRLARSLRQTLALKARLKRAREQAARAAEPERPGGVAVAARVRELRAAARRVVWSEAESEREADLHEGWLDELIEAARAEPAFCEEPLDDQVARLCLELGASPQAACAWRDLPDPPPPAKAPPPGGPAAGRPGPAPA